MGSSYKIVDDVLWIMDIGEQMKNIKQWKQIMDD